MSNSVHGVRLAAVLAALPVGAAIGLRLVQDGVTALARPLTAGASTLDSTVAAAAALAAGAVLLWLTLGAAVTVADVVTSRRGGCVQLLSLLAAWCAPAVLRRGVVAVLGAGVLCSVGLPAHAAAAPAVPVLSAVVDPGWAPFSGAEAEAPLEPRVPTHAADEGGWAPAPPPPVPKAAPADPGPVVGTPRARVAADEAVVVRRGDTLWDIAQRHLPAGATTAQVAAEWPRWFAANRSVIGADPDLLLPGTRLVAPGTAS